MKTDKEGEKLLQDKYAVIESLGNGGMGKVYKVWDIRLEKYWACKEISMGKIRGENGNIVNQTKSLLAELEFLKTAKHIWFPRIVDFFSEGEKIYLIMDCIEGITLEERLKEGKIQVQEAIGYTKEIIRALMCLHHANPPMLYLDLKPSNIILDGEEVRLVDFGSVVAGYEEVKAPHAGSLLYAPPEQVEMDPAKRCVDKRSDIYGIGMVLYRMLTGAEPGTEEQRRIQWEKESVIPYGLQYITEKCLKKERKERYATLEELLIALEKFETRKKKKYSAETLWIIIEFVLCFLTAWQCSEVYPARGSGGDNVQKYMLCMVLFLTAVLWQRLGRYRKGRKRVFYQQEKSILCTENRRRFL